MYGAAAPSQDDMNRAFDRSTEEKRAAADAFQRIYDNFMKHPERIEEMKNHYGLRGDLPKQVLGVDFEAFAEEQLKEANKQKDMIDRARGDVQKQIIWAATTAAAIVAMEVVTSGLINAAIPALSCGGSVVLGAFRGARTLNQIRQNARVIHLARDIGSGWRTGIQMGKMMAKLQHVYMASVMKTAGYGLMDDLFNKRDFDVEKTAKRSIISPIVGILESFPMPRIKEKSEGDDEKKVLFDKNGMPQKPEADPKDDEAKTKRLGFIDDWKRFLSEADWEAFSQDVSSDVFQTGAMGAAMGVFSEMILIRYGAQLKGMGFGPKALNFTSNAGASVIGVGQEVLADHLIEGGQTWMKYLQGSQSKSELKKQELKLEQDKKQLDAQVNQALETLKQRPGDPVAIMKLDGLLEAKRAKDVELDLVKNPSAVQKGYDLLQRWGPEIFFNFMSAKYKGDVPPPNLQESLSYLESLARRRAYTSTRPGSLNVATHGAQGDKRVVTVRMDEAAYKRWETERNLVRSQIKNMANFENKGHAAPGALTGTTSPTLDFDLAFRSKKDPKTGMYEITYDLDLVSDYSASKVLNKTMFKSPQDLETMLFHRALPPLSVLNRYWEGNPASPFYQP